MAASASLLKNSWEEFKKLLTQRWETYAWTVLLRFLLGAVLIAATYGLFSPLIHSLISSPDMLIKGDFHFEPLLSKLGILGLLALLVGLAGALIQFGFLRVVLNPKAAQTVTSLISYGKQRYWSTLGITIVTAFLLVFMVGLGTLAFVLPGIFLGVMVVFAPFVVILDGKGPIESIKQSWAMVEGRWWSVFGTLLVWVILTGVVMMIVNGIIGILFHPFFDDRGFVQLQHSMNAAAASGNIDEALKLLPQLLEKVLNGKALMVFAWQMLSQVIVAIVPLYGFLAVYKVLKKMPKAKKRK